MPLGGNPLTYKRLLDALQLSGQFDVVLQDPGGMHDVGAESEPLYFVKREGAYDDLTVPYSLIEIFHPNTIVADRRLKSICRELKITEDELRALADKLP